MSLPRVLRAFLALLLPALVVGGLTAAPAQAAKPTGSLSGVVSFPGGSLDPDEVEMSLWQYDARWGWDNVDWSWVEADGSYRFTRLPAGTYRIQAEVYEGDAATTWYGDVARIEDATDVPLGKNKKLTGLNIALLPGATIEGTVADPDGEPLKKGTAFLYQTETEEGWTYWSEVNETPIVRGNYVFSAVSAGTYRVCFSASTSNSGSSLVGDCWEGAAMVEDATDIPVTTGQEIAGIDGQVVDGGTVIGTVRDGKKKAVRSVLTILNRQDREGEWQPFGYSMTDRSGGYNFSGVRPGTYRLQYYPFTGNFANEWWNDAASVDSADDITVSAGATFRADAALDTGSSISGTVKGLGRDYGWVEAHVKNGDGTWSFVDGADISSKGRYTITSLPAGTYRLKFDTESSKLKSEWWNDAATRDLAEDVVVKKGKKVTGINATLSAKGGKETITSARPSITGTPKVGATLKAKTGTWKPSRVEHSYQWLADDVAIEGAEKATFVPTAAEQGKRITVDVTGSVDGVEDVTATSAATKPVALGTFKTGTPSLKSATVGAPVTASVGKWTPGNASYSYDWFIGKKLVATTVEPTYVPTADQRGKKLAVRVTATLEGYKKATSKTSKAVTVGYGSVVTEEPTVSGTAEAGQTLTALPGGWGPEGVGLAYQWLVDGKAVKGATAETFVLTDAHLGTRLSVKVTGSLKGYRTASRTSKPTGAVTAPVVVLQ